MNEGIIIGLNERHYEFNPRPDKSESSVIATIWLNY